MTRPLLAPGASALPGLPAPLRRFRRIAWVETCREDRPTAPVDEMSGGKVSRIGAASDERGPLVRGERFDDNGRSLPPFSAVARRILQ